ncbi:MAG: hypothetical protein RLZZ143_2789 [Cyanobacteriota bacterium]|jgi:choice-of-anchor C domain-containing protein
MTQKLAKLNLGGLAKHSLLQLSVVSSVFAVGALIVTPVQAANLIQNGSFETATVNPGSFLQLDAVSTAITGWTVSSGAIDYVGTALTASDGDRSIDLQGTSAGTIEQTFNTIIGKTYRVGFDLAGNPAGDPTIKRMRISAAGSSANFSFDITGKSTTNMGWVSESWDFTATDTTTTLSFSALDNTNFGPALDNVSVTPLSDPTPTSVPEPSSILGLLSLGVLGIGSALKRQS